MIRIFKIVVLVLCTSCLAGCAPHYYEFELIEKSVADNNRHLQLIEQSIVARHLPGNNVDIFQNIKLFNSGAAAQEIKDYDFLADSSVFTYQLSNINQDTGGLENPGAGIVLFDRDRKKTKASIIVAANETLDLTIIYKMSSKIPEQEFKKKRTGEQLKIELVLQESKFTYKFRAKND